MKNSSNSSQVLIYGGGMAGAVLAKKLSKQYSVTLVDPNDYYEVPMAAPRALLKPDFANQSIVLFSQALPSVRHVRGMLVGFDAQGGVVRTQEGTEIRLTGDVTVLATGSSFSNSLMRSTGASAIERKALYVKYHDRIKQAKRVLIVGGGPIGVEMAGEITENYPKTQITMLEAGSRILGGTSEEASRYAEKVLTGRGVTILTSEKLMSASSTPADVFSDAGEAKTDKGRAIQYDLLIWCTGGKPNTGYMNAAYKTVLNAVGRICVTPKLRVVGHDTLFALGDITDLDENKMAWHITPQVEVAVANIRQVLAGRRSDNDLKTHHPKTNDPTMAVTLGSRMGVLQLPMLGTVRAPWFNRMAKATHMLVPKYRKILGV
jgi:apoptosis-inducing factor 2